MRGGDGASAAGVLAWGRCSPVIQFFRSVRRCAAPGVPVVLRSWAVRFQGLSIPESQPRPIPSLASIAGCSGKWCCRRSAGVELKRLWPMQKLHQLRSTDRTALGSGPGRRSARDSTSRPWLAAFFGLMQQRSTSASERTPADRPRSALSRRCSCRNGPLVVGMGRLAPGYCPPPKFQVYGLVKARRARF